MSLKRANRFARQAQSALQPLVVAALVLASVSAVIITGLAFAGRLPWPEIQIGYDGAPLDIGMYVQIGLTALLLMLGIYLPTTWRVQRLELSHRRFEIGMADVTRAYAVAHAGDRAGAFYLKNEFDAVRERFQFLRDHPDLGDMEPGILEVAAQMSHVSAELAHTYSDEKVERARTFLRQRQEELAQFDARIEQATAITHEIVHWARQLELEEAVANSKLDRLKEELREVLPAVLPPAARTTEVQRRLSELSEKSAVNRTPAE
jgi:NTP pyrophosphatase (non-canonical NTP hydrolase)